MKIVTGILLLTFVVFLHFKFTESRNNGQTLLQQRRTRHIDIQDESTIFIDLADGTIVGGVIRQQEHYQFPAWIREGYHGLFLIYLQRPNNIGYIVTNIHQLERRHNNIGIMRATIEVPGSDFSQAILSPIGRDLYENTRARIYVGLPNGRTYTGYFV